MDRETATFTTPSGIVIETVTYLIGREKRALQNAYLGGNLSFNLESDQMTGINPDALNRAQEVAWKTIVLKINGKRDGEDGFSIVDTILDMRSEDYDFVVAKVNEINTDAKKKTT